MKLWIGLDEVRLVLVSDTGPDSTSEKVVEDSICGTVTDCDTQKFPNYHGNKRSNFKRVLSEIIGGKGFEIAQMRLSLCNTEHIAAFIGNNDVADSSADSNTEYVLDSGVNVMGRVDEASGVKLAEVVVIALGRCVTWQLP